MKVYWSVFHKGIQDLKNLNDPVSELRFFEPTPLNKHIDMGEFLGPHVSHCPALTDDFKNTFACKAPLDFYASYDYDKNTVKFKHDYDQEFAMNLCGPPTKERIHQIQYPAYVFWCEESVTVSTLPAYYENNNFTNNCMILAGTFDVGNWVRPINPAFKFKDKTIVDFKAEDVLYYIRINTKERIKLVKFDGDNEETRKVIEKCMTYKFKSRFGIPDKLADCYKAFKRHQINKQMKKIVEKYAYE